MVRNHDENVKRVEATFPGLLVIGFMNQPQRGWGGLSGSLGPCVLWQQMCSKSSLGGFDMQRYSEDCSHSTIQSELPDQTTDWTFNPGRR
jgi:hypothetical protein